MICTVPDKKNYVDIYANPSLGLQANEKTSVVLGVKKPTSKPSQTPPKTTTDKGTEKMTIDSPQPTPNQTPQKKHDSSPSPQSPVMPETPQLASQMSPPTAVSPSSSSSEKKSSKKYKMLPVIPPDPNRECGPIITVGNKIIVLLKNGQLLVAAKYSVDSHQAYPKITKESSTHESISSIPAGVLPSDVPLVYVKYPVQITF